jgi:hypothetical protein
MILRLVDHVQGYMVGAFSIIFFFLCSIKTVCFVSEKHVTEISVATVD